MPRHGDNIKRTPGGRWQANYRRLDGKEVSKTFDRRSDAERWRREGLAVRDRGGLVDPKAGRATVREYGERWRAAQLQHRPTTRRLVESTLRLHVYPHLGDRPMNRVLRGDVQALVKRWEDEGGAPRSIRDTWYGFLRSMFHAAVADEVISRSPCVDIRLPEVVDIQVTPLTAAQVQDLADAIDRRFRAVVLLGYGCGPRISEAAGLTLPNVDFLGREVAISQQLSPRKPYPLVPLKNSRRRPSRVVPAPSYVLEALSEHIRVYGTGERDLVFTAAQGGPAISAAIGTAFRAARKKVGLPKHVTFHDLRHSYASEMLVQGLSVVEVAELIGDTVAMVEKTYGHPTIDFRKRARLAVEAAWAAREPVAEPLRSAEGGQASDQR
jgi:integrase